jgi:hypothetical protein
MHLVYQGVNYNLDGYRKFFAPTDPSNSKRIMFEYVTGGDPAVGRDILEFETSTDRDEMFGFINAAISLNIALFDMNEMSDERKAELRKAIEKHDEHITDEDYGMMCECGAMLGDPNQFEQMHCAECKRTYARDKKDPANWICIHNPSGKDA